MNLSDCPLDTQVCVQAVRGDRTQCLRLLELGIYPGQCIEAIYEGAFGRRIIAVDHQRIAMDPKSTAHIRVAVV